MTIVEDDFILIKRNDAVGGIVLAFVGEIIFFLPLFCYTSRIPVGLLIFFFLLLTVVIVKESLAFFKTIKLTKDGYILSFWLWSKEYRWEELKTIRYTDFTNGFSLFAPHRYHQVVFEASPKSIRKSLYRTPELYFDRHPFTSVLLYLSKEPLKENHNGYIIEEAVLKQKLAEWGVEVEVLR